MTTFGNLKIYGRPQGQGYGEEFISKLTLDQYDAKFDETTKKWQCQDGRGTLYSNNGGAGGPNWAYGTYDDELGESHSGDYEWLPARIHSNAELKDRSTIKEEVLLLGEKKCVAMSLGEEGALYSALEEVYPTN